MTQNTSTAVMQRRHEAMDSLDDFPTPPWATRALLEKLLSYGFPLSYCQAWEPACNLGYMARPLGEAFGRVHATDVRDYGWAGQDGVVDFLIDWAQDAPDVDWIITNPPFRLGAEFIRHALRYARTGVAVFVRSAFVEGVERYQTLFRDQPEAFVFPFVERVVLHKCVLLDPDVSYWDAKANGGQGGLKKPSTATAYTWLVFLCDDRGGGALHERIAPCRKRLTRPGDYPPLPDYLRPPEADAGLFDG